MIAENKYNDTRCMAVANSTGKRCSNKVKSTENEFCHKHNHSHSHKDVNNINYSTNIIEEIKGKVFEKLVINEDELKCQILSDYIIDNIKEQNIENDLKYKHNLMSMYDSWYEVKIEYQIKLANENWELSS